jgi:hypothetical protein
MYVCLKHAYFLPITAKIPVNESMNLTELLYIINNFKPNYALMIEKYPNCLILNFLKLYS